MLSLEFRQTVNFLYLIQYLMKTFHFQEVVLYLQIIKKSMLM
jgi:hypothetical protein